MRLVPHCDQGVATFANVFGVGMRLRNANGAFRARLTLTSMSSSRSMLGV
jgi:hypothetical protein